MKRFNVGIKGVIVREDGAVLLLKKNKADGAFWEAPGGRIDGQETVEQTLQRELQEELPGISDIKITRLLTAFRLPFDIGEDLGLMLIYHEVSATLPEPIQLSDEHSDYIWVHSPTDVAIDHGTKLALEAVFASQV